MSEFYCVYCHKYLKMDHLVFKIAHTGTNATEGCCGWCYLELTNDSDEPENTQ